MSTRRDSFGGVFRGARVLVTGHTGFKGSWLCEWLLGLGAEVSGLALPPEADPALFDELQLAERLRHRVGDIRDSAVVSAAVDAAEPDFVFHLAAQALVRRSYQEPLETWDTNVLGTVRVLEALRRAGRPCTVVCVTSDKCYENREWLHGYRETDALGGHDPYSSSKAAAEIAIASWRASLLGGPEGKVRVASARAGNVLGGGDRAADRIVPDFLRALAAGEPLRVRNPSATRPWQHVLEPLSGYLHLAARLHGAAQFGAAWNFGPDRASNRTVRDLVLELLRHRPGTYLETPDVNAPHEAGLLFLATEKARDLLGWRPVWDFARTVRETVTWESGTESALARTREQIASYSMNAAHETLAWAPQPE